MKTPRMILLHRHRAIEPRLDQIRRSVLSTELRVASAIEREWERAQGEQSSAWAATVWRELIWSCRRAWFGLAFAWVVVLGLALATPTPEEPSESASSTSTLSPEVMAALREQSRLLSELLKAQALSAGQNQPPALPQRRSERGSRAIAV